MPDAVNPILLIIQIDDEPSGFFYDLKTKKCAKCKKWTYPEKSCAQKDEDAQREDCHEYGEHLLNKKCFIKDVIKGADVG